MKTILIPFSGGLDSTYLIWKNLKEGNRVIAIYFTVENNNNKVTLEKIHRQKILDILKKEYSNTLIDDHYFQYKVYIRGIKNDYRLIQVPIWMLGAFTACNEEIDEIQMGYVLNDDAVSFLEEIRNLFKAYEPFSKKKLPKITFPIIKKAKEEIIFELPTNILKYVYSCENPNVRENDDYVFFSNCNYCVPCVKYKTKKNYILDVLFSSEIEKKYDKHTKEITFYKKNNPDLYFSYDDLSFDDIQDKVPTLIVSKEDKETINIKTSTLNKIINNSSDLTPEELGCINYYKRTICKTPIQQSLFSEEEMKNLIINKKKKKLIFQKIKFGI